MRQRPLAPFVVGLWADRGTVRLCTVWVEVCVYGWIQTFSGSTLEGDAKATCAQVEHQHCHLFIAYSASRQQRLLDTGPHVHFARIQNLLLTT